MLFMKPKISSMTMEQAKEELEAGSTALLIDVRTPEEYRQGHLPNSRNLPLDQAQSIVTRIPDHAARLFVYCQSGMRSRSACDTFQKLGYSDVTNIGGISAWNGAVERGAEQ